MRWRWDQGRLQYFEFDSIRSIAGSLVQMDGADITSSVDVLRSPLMQHTEFPFAPTHYKVWRNYARVFGCQMLAAQVGDHLICTELCHQLAQTPSEVATADDYLAHLTKRFYYPSPVFEGYNTTAQQTFPFCAVIKLLLSKKSQANSDFVTLQEVFEKLIANNSTGKEPLAKYSLLTAKSISPSPDERRQVRELLIFMSQFSFLKWENPKLFLDVSELSDELLHELENLATPLISPRKTNRSEEIVALGKMPTTQIHVPEMKDRIYSEDSEFIEGRKVRITHLRTERSRKLRQLFFASLPLPYLCDACVLQMDYRYPWTDNLLEIHHVLPLSSPTRIESGKTSIKDLVGLCPSCHRAIHSFYRKWLMDEEQDDFSDHTQAKEIYEQAKREVVLS